MLFDDFTKRVSRLEARTYRGTVRAIDSGIIRIIGLGYIARIGDLVEISGRGREAVRAEIIAVGDGSTVAMSYSQIEGLSEGDSVRLLPRQTFAPCDAWLGKVVDAFGTGLDGNPVPQGETAVDIRANPPSAVLRRRTGARLNTGLAVLDTVLPIVEGQRIGLFAGSGVGKSRLLSRFVKRMQADVVVVGLIGERGREVLEFVESTVGEEGMTRCCVVAATSDQPAAVRRRAAWAAMATAEHFRDQGKNVLLLFDSLTRFAEAHREIALAAGEAASLRGFPPSTTQMIASLVERAGPGPASGSSDITAVFTVLVAGSDMEEPLADIVRGLLDGHVLLSRKIAERGRFPAIDVLRSVSRSLPDAASDDENKAISRVRSILSRYDEILPMLEVGLYKRGVDAATDHALDVWAPLDAMFAEDSGSVADSFERLGDVLEKRAKPAP